MRARAGLRVAAWLATLACVSSLYEDQVLPVPPLACPPAAAMEAREAFSERARHGAGQRPPWTCAHPPPHLENRRHGEGVVLACSRNHGPALPPLRQVGKNDFHLENIGDLTTAQFHPDTQRKRLYFATVSGTAAPCCAAAAAAGCSRTLRC